MLYELILINEIEQRAKIIFLSVFWNIVKCVQQSTQVIFQMWHLWEYFIENIFM